MTDYLIIRVREQDRTEWLVVDDDGNRKSEIGVGTLAEAAAFADSRRTIALLPAHDIVTTQTDLPIKGAKLIAALPFALEDQFADDVELLQFAPGPRNAEGNVPVAVIARQRLDDWLDQFATVGLRPARVVADYHGVVAVPNTLSMLIEDDLVMFNDGRGTHIALAGASPADLIAAAGYIDQEETADLPRSLVVYCSAAADERFAADWAALRHELDTVEIHHLPDGALSRLAIPIATGDGIDLLQGAYGEKTEFRAYLKPWKAAATLFAALLLTGFVGKAADVIRLGDEEAALRAQFTAIYRDIRPNDQREIMDPVGTVRSISRGLTNTALPVFLPSMQSLAGSLSENGPIAIEAITYRAGVIDIRLTAKDVAALDRIQKSVNSSGRFVATIQSTTQAEDGVASRLQIRESGA